MSRAEYWTPGHRWNVSETSSFHCISPSHSPTTSKWTPSHIWFLPAATPIS
jgi:hypothetical protein